MTCWIYCVFREVSWFSYAIVNWYVNIISVIISCWKICVEIFRNSNWNSVFFLFFYIFLGDTIAIISGDDSKKIRSDPLFMSFLLCAEWVTVRGWWCRGGGGVRWINCAFPLNLRVFLANSKFHKTKITFHFNVDRST